MTVSDVNETSTTEKLLLRAVLISLLLHLLIFSIWRVGENKGWWANIIMPQWMQNIAKVLVPQIPKQLKPPEETTQIPLNFVEIDPALATTEPPKKPVFIGAQNTKVANREIKTPSDVPNLDGKQEQFLKTLQDSPPKPKTAPAMSVEPETPAKLARARAAVKRSEPAMSVEPETPAKPTPATPAQPQTPPVNPTPAKQVAPKEALTPGDLAMVRPEDKERKGKRDADVAEQTVTQSQPQIQPQPESPPEHHRPRTVAEAMARNGTPGQVTHQVGGVNDLKTDASLDVQGTPLGNYLGTMVDAVKGHWYQLLENQSANTSGRVVLHFRLNPDGRITNMKVVQNEVGDLLQTFCERAVMEPRFDKWPREMRLSLPNDFYDITFTFYYEP